MKKDMIREITCKSKLKTSLKSIELKEPMYQEGVYSIVDSEIVLLEDKELEKVLL